MRAQVQNFFSKIWSANARDATVEISRFWELELRFAVDDTFLSWECTKYCRILIRGSPNVSRFAPKPLSQAIADQVLALKLSWILEGCRPLCVYLFGSVARGEMTEQSDFDFALLFESRNKIREAQKNFYNRPRHDEWPQDILWFTKDEFIQKSQVGGVCFVIAQEGIVIYEGSSN